MFANIGPWQLLIILLIVLAIFGTKKQRNTRSDHGGPVTRVRKAMNHADETAEQLATDAQDADFDSTPAEKAAKEKDA